MSRTKKKNDKPWVKKWGNKAGRGKHLKRVLHKAIRKHHKQKLEGNKPKSYSGKASEVSWRGW